MDYSDRVFYRHSGVAYYKCADFSPAGIFIPHIMIAVFRRLNAWFIAMVLIGVYFLGIGFARIIYVFTAPKEKPRDSYWSYPRKRKEADALFSPY